MVCLFDCFVVVLCDLSCGFVCVFCEYGFDFCACVDGVSCECVEWVVFEMSACAELFAVEFDVMFQWQNF